MHTNDQDAAIGSDFIRKTDWHFFHQRYRSPAFCELFVTGFGIQSEQVPFDHRARYLGHFFNHVTIAEKERARVRDAAIKHLQIKPEFMLDLMGYTYVEHQRALKEWEAVSQTDVKSMHADDLIQTLKSYQQRLHSFSFTLSLPLFLEDYLEQTLLGGLKKHFGDDASRLYNLVANPIKDGTVLQEELALLELAEKNSVSEAALKKHAAQFSWMANVGYTEDYYPIDYYKKLLEEIQTHEPRTRRKEIEETRARHRAEFQQILEKLSDDSHLATLAKTANEAVYFRSYRTELCYSSARFFTPLFKEIARRLGLPNYKDVAWLYLNEISAALTQNKSVNLKLIEQRKKGYAFLTTIGGAFLYWDGDDARRMFEAFEQSRAVDVNVVREVRGSPAFHGNVRGSVVVVHSLDELKKVKKGDVLVTHATNVNFVPILNKVSAIVTEEGGILSHAAIISREMSIPCVIGTKIATKVFKDGGIVEVDAERGIVRKL